MLLGFEPLRSSLINSYESSKLHHAILLQSKQGVGKASFTKDLVLKNFLNTENESHPDLLIIEKEEGKKEIKVDSIRKISQFVNKTSAISENKFIIIDSASELNKSSSNALLKILEEPHPNNFLILISHNLNKVLPTIKSRCQIIKIPELKKSDFDDIVKNKGLNLTAEHISFLSEICDNSPAQAINLGEDLVRFYELFLRSVINKKISEELIKKISNKDFSQVIFEKIFEFFISRLMKFSQNIEFKLYFEEEKTFSKILNKTNLDEIFRITEESLNLLRKTSSIHLDKKLNFINIFNKICYA